MFRGDERGFRLGRFAIVAYSPKPGMADRLLSVVRKHLTVLAAEDLVSSRPAYVMRAIDGTIVEVFEWRSTEAIARAHTSPAVASLWAEFADTCNFQKLNELPECKQMFAEFEAVDL